MLDECLKYFEEKLNEHKNLVPEIRLFLQMVIMLLFIKMERIVHIKSSILKRIVYLKKSQQVIF